MFERRWLLGPVVGAALLFGACSGGGDDSDETPLPIGGDVTATAGASPEASATTGGGSPAPSASSTPAASSRTPVLDAEFAEDPCTVLSDEEVQSTVGGPVISAQGVADRVQPFCRWLLDASGQEEPAIQDMVIASIGNTALFDNPAATDKVEVNGLGDAAYIVPISGEAAADAFELWVREGAKTLLVQFQVNDERLTTDAEYRDAYNARSQEIAEALAGIALERI